MALYREHLEMIQALPEPEEEIAEEAVPVSDEPVFEPVAMAISEEEMPITEEVNENINADEIFVVPEAEVIPITESLFEVIPDEAEDAPETNGGRFSDLQFGEEYTITEEPRGFFKRKK